MRIIVANDDDDENSNNDNANCWNHLRVRVHVLTLFSDEQRTNHNFFLLFCLRSFSTSSMRKAEIKFNL